MLSKDDKERIKEEELFREKVRSDKQAKDVGIGCLSVIAIAVAVGLWIALSTEPETPEEQAIRRAEQRASQNTQIAKVRPAPQPKLKVLNFRCYSEHVYMFVSGEVKNTSSSKLKNVVAVGTFRAADGTHITTETALLEYNPIMPGQTSPFQAGGKHNPLMTKCSLGFKYLLGGSIPYTSD